MSRIIVRLPEPKDEYEVTTQRQINPAVTGLVDQLNTTNQQLLTDVYEAFTLFMG